MLESRNVTVPNVLVHLTILTPAKKYSAILVSLQPLPILHCQLLYQEEQPASGS